MKSISPFASVAELSLAESRWEGGFWGSLVERLAGVMVPHMWSILDDSDMSHAFANFRIAAGLEQGEHSGPPFFDGDLYKWLEAAALAYSATDDASLDALMDEVIAVIAAAQRGDGYIHTPVIIAQRGGRGLDKELSERLHFEVYNLGHLMTAACRHREATGKDSLFTVALKAADFLKGYFRDPSPETAKNNICPSHIMGLVDLYRASGDRSYLELAESCIRMRDLIEDGTDDNQDRIPLRDQRRAVGHAVRANYLFAGAADVLAETGDKSLWPALESVWENVVSSKMYITGSCGALFDGVSPDGAEDHDAIQRIHQAYGREYQLPNATAYNEVCAAVGNALWNWRMFKLRGEAKYMDVVETVLYNALLVGISLDGKKYFYRTALRQGKELPFYLRWPRSRAAYLSSFCCPPNLIRTIGAASTMAYAASEDGIFVNLYGSGTLDTKLRDGSRLKLRQETEYPWEGRVVLRIEEAPEKPIALRLRVPAWAKGATLAYTQGRDRAAGIAEDEARRPTPVEAGGYAKVERRFRQGDELILELPLEARLVLANELVEETRNQVALCRGPIVYCLESKDLPEGIGVGEIVLPSDARFEARPGSGILSSARVLEGEVLRLAADLPSSELYAEIPPHKLSRFRARFVPYYAWDNRGLSEMSVWLPLRWE